MVSSLFFGSNNCFTTRVNRYRDNTQIIFVAFRDFVNKGLMPMRYHGVQVWEDKAWIKDADSPVFTPLRPW